METAGSTSSSVKQPPGRRGTAVLVGSWIIATAFAIVGAWLGERLFVARTEVTLARQQTALVELALKSTEQQLDAERIINSRQIASLLNQSDAATGRAPLKIAVLQGASASPAAALWDTVRNAGVITMTTPLSLAPGQMLEVWFFSGSPASKPVSAGALKFDAGTAVRASFRTPSAVENVSAIGISREKADGAPHASPTEVLLRGDLR